jgi:hypothetical protein
MAGRTDIHSIKNADYHSYDYIVCFYEGSCGDTRMAYGEQLEYRNALSQAIAAGKLFSNANGGCDHCGAYYAHGVLVCHQETGEYIRIGHQCAENFFSGFRNARAMRKDIARRVANIKRENSYKAKSKADRDAVLAVNPGLEQCLAMTHHATIENIGERFERWGKISEAQISLVFKIASELYRPALPPKDLVPVPTGKAIEIMGEVLTIKVQEGFYGDTYKMLVADERGFKVWGSLPAALNDAQRGAKVKFIAGLEQSADDPSFGFFKRPRKAQILG